MLKNPQSHVGKFNFRQQKYIKKLIFSSANKKCMNSFFLNEESELVAAEQI